MLYILATPLTPTPTSYLSLFVIPVLGNCAEEGSCVVDPVLGSYIGYTELYTLLYSYGNGGKVIISKNNIGILL